jgi:GTP-binding protein EngB required for normal cell division
MTELIENNNNFKKLVNLVDKLRDIGLNDLISMPRIAVLGSQSSGKSSLLESIVGLNFLPRGSGVVTRRPLELRMIRTKVGSEPTYAIFKNDPKKYFDFNEVRMVIEKLTNELCGDNKGIVDDPIILQIFGEHCSDLTVIDLPGITRIAIGNQPKNIEQITKDMVTRYCKDERTIILCVVPANADMTTSEALQLAQYLDKDGIRTIGVITKIDIMDKGTDARTMLLNKEIPPKLGYIGVKGRSQEDVNNKVTVKEALNTEMAFFENHPAYRHLPKQILTTNSLVTKLITVMYDHIKTVLPSILKEINYKIKNCEDNMKKLGEPIPIDNKKKLDAIWRDISVFYDKFKSNVKGEYLEIYQKQENKEKMKILASAQIFILFNDLYKNYLHNYKASNKYKDNEINKIVGMYTGNTLPGFVSIDCFVALMSPLLENIRIPAMQLVDKVYQILKSTGSKIINETFNKLLSIRDTLIMLFNEILQLCKEKCEKYLNNIIDCQTQVVFTKDPSFIISAHSWPETLKAPQTQNPKIEQNDPQNPNQNIKGTPQNQNPSTQQHNTNKNEVNLNSTNSYQNTSNVIRNEVHSDPRGSLTQKNSNNAENTNTNTHKLNEKERKNFLVQEMRKRIDHYFEINIKQLGDMVPKIITKFLIDNILDKIYFSMFRKVSDKELLDSLREPDHIMQHRNNLEKMLDTLRASKNILMKDKDINFEETNNTTE